MSNASIDERLIVFTRFPHPGRTKSRMIPVLGAEGAAALQREMTVHTLNWARDFRRNRGARVEIHYAGGHEVQMKQTFGHDLNYFRQADGDLGARLRHAARTAFGSGASAVVFIGADCPGLTSTTLVDAFQRLRQCDVVLGPASDGGYYLVGLRVCRPALFEGVNWGTDSVLSETLRIAARLNLSAALMGELDDVDRPEDLRAWEQRPLAPDANIERLSIIVPALNEERNIEHCLAPLLAAGSAEVILVDGGSRDRTCKLAAAMGAQVLNSPPGRALQMNTGAAAATGDMLVFVHADTRLQMGFEHPIRKLLAQPGVVCGAFEFAVDSQGWNYRLLEFLVNRRSRSLQMPYGDQALFMRASTFNEAGGFPAFPVMEDFELVRRLTRIGSIALAPMKAFTSSRSWDAGGLLRETCLNQLCVIGYLAGVPPSRIAEWRKKK